MRGGEGRGGAGGLKFRVIFIQPGLGSETLYYCFESVFFFFFSPMILGAMCDMI